MKLDLAEPRAIVVVNTARRPSYFDVLRPDSTRRKELEAGEEFQCIIGPGPAVVSFGYGVKFRWDDEPADRWR